MDQRQGCCFCTTPAAPDAPSPQTAQQSGNGAYVDCPTADQCVLLYNYQTSGGGGNAEAGAIYNGTQWSTLGVPAGILIRGASCPGKNDCYAIGGTSFNNPGLSESHYHFDGTTWAQGATLPSATSGGRWSTLACVTGTADCWAGGGGPVTEGDATPTVIAHLFDDQWESANLPSGIGEIQDMLCLRPSVCVAVEAGGGSGSTAQTNGTPLDPMECRLSGV